MIYRYLYIRCTFSFKTEYLVCMLAHSLKMRIRKRLVRDIFDTLLHIPTLFATPLIQTPGHKIKALMIVFLQLPTVNFFLKEQKSNKKLLSVEFLFHSHQLGPKCFFSLLPFPSIGPKMLLQFASIPIDWAQNAPSVCIPFNIFQPKYDAPKSSTCFFLHSVSVNYDQNEKKPT